MTARDFAGSESGAVTVDWVVLTAALVGLALAVLTLVSSGVEDLSGDVAIEVAGLGIGNPFGDNGAGVMANSGWGDLTIFSPRQTASQAETYVDFILSQNGGDYQATYNQLYQQALDMTYAHGESIDDFGAFEALAAENGVRLETGDDMTYAEMHAIYEANGAL